MVFSLRKSNLSPGGRTLPGVVFVIMLCFLLIIVENIFAQESPSQLPSATETPTPDISTSPSAAPETVPTATPPIDAPSVTPETAALPTAIPDLSPTSTLQNNTDAINQASETSSSSAIVNTIAVINTNASGSDPTVLNYVEATAEAIDLTNTGSCNASDSATLAAIINNANISNIIDVNSITGTNPTQTADNSSTTPASATANVFNMANTNLSGSCWNFLVMNFFAPHTGNVILPSYQNFVKPTASSMAPASANILDIMNNATITNILNAQANTGSANSSILQTGNAITRVQTQNLINTTLEGNNWLFLTIRSYGGWDGTLLNWPGNLIQTPGFTYAYLPLSYSTGAASEMSIVNNANVTNRISAYADSGSNASPQDSFFTGTANATVNLFNFINTTIAGNNWYFAYITIFDTFKGNFLFPETYIISITPTPSSVSIEANPTATVIQTTLTPTDIPKSAAVAYTRPTANVTADFQPDHTATSQVIGTATQSPKGKETPVNTAGFFFSSTAFLGLIIKHYLSLRQT